MAPLIGSFFPYGRPLTSYLAEESKREYVLLSSIVKKFDSYTFLDTVAFTSYFP